MKTIHVILKGLYSAKVSGRIVTVRVDDIRTATRYKRSPYSGRTEPIDTTVYDVTNLETGRRTTFKSARKLRRFVASCIINGTHYASPAI